MEILKSVVKVMGRFKREELGLFEIYWRSGGYLFPVTWGQWRGFIVENFWRKGRSVKKG
jgi:hypothetical protein